MRALFSIIAGMLLAGSASADKSERRSSDEPIVLGFVENVEIGRLRLEMKAKLDTGADTSSVFARDIEVYKKSGKDEWVRFRLVGKNGRSIRYDQNVIRFALIKLKTGGSIRRPVVDLPLCVGGMKGSAEINLADRADFNYDVLVGREFLASRIIVDSASTFIAEEGCGEE